MLMNKNAFYQSYKHIFKVGPSIVTLNKEGQIFCKGDINEIAELFTVLLRNFPQQYDLDELLKLIAENLHSGKYSKGEEVYGVMSLYRE